MNTRQAPIKLPTLFSAGSFLVMIGLLLLTSPLKNIIYAIAFFVALVAFLVSIGYLVVRLHSEQVSLKARFRIFIIAIFITVLVMFISARAISWVDSLVLVLIAIGLLFYSGRRI